MNKPQAKCVQCGSMFVKTKRTKLYCSPPCQKAWWKRNPSKNNARSKKRRRANPGWYRQNESRYYRTYRAKALSKKPWKYLLQSRRLDASKRNILFDLTDLWAEARWTGKCEITGLEFSKQGEGRGPHPFSPSLDRIDPKLGYVQSNSRFILWGCNAIKGVGTDADMYAIAQAIVLSTGHMDSSHG